MPRTMGRWDTRRTSWLIAVIGALSIAQSAWAFSSQGRRWPNAPGEPVSYRLHPDGSDDVPDGTDLEAIRRAFRTWEGVACSYLRFREDPWMEPQAVGNDGVNRIQFVEDAARWTASPGTLALTFTFYRTTDNVITDADMAINGTTWSFTTTDSQIGMGSPAKVDVETVVFHEIGHYFGLDHSMDPSAAMYPTNNKPMQRQPANDDIQGICSLYPNGMPVPNQPSGGAVGAPCQVNGDCQSQLCASDGVLNRNYCTAQCTPNTQNACPLGYECATTSQGNYCLVPLAIDELCDFCELGSQCSTGFCVKVPGYNQERPFCSRPCDNTPGQPQVCPEGYRCEAVGGTQAGGACAPASGVCEPLGKGGQGEVCFANGQCKAGFTCVDYFPNSGLSYCYFACGLEFVGQTCQIGGLSLCDRVAALENTAVCFPLAPVGAPCIPEICDNRAFCAYDEAVGPDSALCYRICQGGQGDCPAQEMCTQFSGLPPLCVPLQGFKYEGDACSSDSECRSRVCRTYGANQLCTNPCAINNPADCGPGLKCLPQPGQTQGLCWPQSFIDPNAGVVDRTRPITTSGFCACDTTTACDADCPCDAECVDSCSCSTAADRESGLLSLVVLVLLAGARRRRDRPRAT